MSLEFIDQEGLLRDVLKQFSLSSSHEAQGRISGSQPQVLPIVSFNAQKGLDLLDQDALELAYHLPLALPIRATCH
jgi:hypothetical protein